LESASSCAAEFVVRRRDSPSARIRPEPRSRPALVSPARTEKLGTLSASDSVRVLAEADALKRACTRGAFGSAELRKKTTPARCPQRGDVLPHRLDRRRKYRGDRADERCIGSTGTRRGGTRVAQFVKLREPGNRGREHAPSIGTVRDVWRPDALDPERLACR